MMPIIASMLCNAPAIAYTLRQVLDTPNKKRSNRHDSAVLSCPNCAISPSATGGNGYGQDGANGNAARTTSCVCLTSCPPDALDTQEVVFMLKKESETMTTLTVAHSVAPASSKPDTIPTCNLQAVLAAYSACNLASSYIERGNFTAARRKLILALRDIELLTKLQEGTAQ